MTRIRRQDPALELVDDLVANGCAAFTFAEAVRRLGRSKTASANLLRRLVRLGLLDCVRRGHYVVRPLGALGTSAASEDLGLAVGAAFAGRSHRIGYRSALDEHGLSTQPSRTIQVALTERTRTTRVSGRKLKVILEPRGGIDVGAVAHGASRVSDHERSLLDAAARPDLVSTATLTEALVAAGARLDLERLVDHARRLAWGAALRRIGSLADALQIDGVAGRLQPLAPPTGDIDLEPGHEGPTRWRDARWRVQWPQSREELANVARQ